MESRFIEEGIKAHITNTPFAMKKVLIITYYWPPSGGAGVQRWLKFVKYLPKYEWQPIVLTIDTKYATYPLTDPSLLDDIPDNVDVYATKAINYFSLYSKNASQVPSAGFAVNSKNNLKNKISRFIRGNFFIPDPRRGWNKYAVRKAAELIRDNNISHIITTSPPHSTQLIGLKLKKMFPSIKWIADMRDPWTDIYYYDQFLHTPLAKKIDKRYELSVLQNADRVITVGSIADIFASKGKGIFEKTAIITNGYDDDDFSDVRITPPDVFTITYCGTIAGSYPINPLLDALAKINESGRQYLLKFIGVVNENTQRHIVDTIGADKVEFVPYTPHKEVINIISSASALLLLIPNDKNSESTLPGKLFEYVATRRPVIFIGPANGYAANILRGCGHSSIFDINDADGIYDYLDTAIAETMPQPLPEHPEFSREVLTGKLSEILNGAK